MVGGDPGDGVSYYDGSSSSEGDPGDGDESPLAGKSSKLEDHWIPRLPVNAINGLFGFGSAPVFEAHLGHWLWTLQNPKCF